MPESSATAPTASVAAGTTLGWRRNTTWSIPRPRSYELPCPVRTGAGRSAGPGLQPEMLASQLEGATEICADLDDVRRALVAACDVRPPPRRRCRARRSWLPAATRSRALGEIEVMARPRYACSSIGSGRSCRSSTSAAATCTSRCPTWTRGGHHEPRATPICLCCAALTGSSPFHEGQDTGYESFRLPWLGLWPQGGPPPHWPRPEDYLATIEQSVAPGWCRTPARCCGTCGRRCATRPWSSGPPTCAPTSTTRCCSPVWSGRWSGCWPRASRPVAVAADLRPDAASGPVAGRPLRPVRHALVGRPSRPGPGRGRARRSAVRATRRPGRATASTPSSRELLDRLRRRGTSAQRQREDFAGVRQPGRGGPQAHRTDPARTEIGGQLGPEQRHAWWRR